MNNYDNLSYYDEFMSYEKKDGLTIGTKMRVSDYSLNVTSFYIEKYGFYYNGENNNQKLNVVIY